MEPFCCNNLSIFTLASRLLRVYLQDDFGTISEWMPKLVAVHSAPDVPSPKGQAACHTMYELGATIGHLRLPDQRGASDLESTGTHRCALCGACAVRTEEGLGHSASTVLGLCQSING